MIHCLIDAEEAVVGETEDIHLYRRILGVVAVDVELELARDLLRVDGDLHFGGSLVEKGEHGLPFSVKTYGIYLVPPLLLSFEVTICDLKHSSGVN